MLRKYIGITGKLWLDDLILLVIAAGIICFLAPIVLMKETDLPITRQSLMVVLIPMLFGLRAGAGAVALYLVVGALGAPVFAEYKGGIERFARPSGGFLIAFLIAAVVCGYLAESLKPRERLRQALYILLGYMIILAFGLYWYWGMIEETNKWEQLRRIFLPNSMVKAAISFVFIQVAIRAVIGKKEFYNLKNLSDMPETNKE